MESILKKHNVELNEKNLAVKKLKDDNDEWVYESFER